MRIARLSKLRVWEPEQGTSRPSRLQSRRTTPPYPQDQFALNRLRLKGQAAPAIWNAVLAA